VADKPRFSTIGEVVFLICFEVSPGGPSRRWRKIQILPFQRADLPNAATACAGASRTANLSSCPQLITVVWLEYSLTQITRSGFTKTSRPSTSSNITKSMLPPFGEPLIDALCWKCQNHPIIERFGRLYRGRTSFQSRRFRMCSGNSPNDSTPRSVFPQLCTVKSLPIVTYNLDRANRKRTMDSCARSRYKSSRNWPAQSVPLTPYSVRF
jgi:hypothetical protein